MFNTEQERSEITLPPAMRRRGNEQYRDRDRDRLTGLPGRDFFISELEQAIRLAAGGRRIALHVIRISNLEELVFEYGQLAGEPLLKATGRRLYGIFHADKLFARLGGGEFGLLQRRVEHDGHALYTARRVAEVFSEPLKIASLTVPVRLATGIAFFPDHGRDWETLHRRARETPA